MRHGALTQTPEQSCDEYPMYRISLFMLVANIWDERRTQGAPATEITWHGL